MKEKVFVLAGLLVLTASTAIGADSSFRMKALDGVPGCQLLYDVDTLVVRRDRKKNRNVAMGLGKCPWQHPTNRSLNVWTLSSIQFDMGGRLVRAFSFPDKKEKNAVTKVVVRKGEPGLGKGGAYRYYWSKIK